MKTFTAKPHLIKRDWILIDAAGLPIGRLAVKIAALLQGKHKTIYTPHEDTGDAVVIINASQVTASGNKEETKMYYNHSGYPGGIKEIALKDLRKKAPERIIERAVKGMLPKGPLGRDMYRKLWIYAGAEHPHQAQQPQLMNLEGL